MNGVGHGSPEWLDLDGRLARLQEIPIVLEFLAVNLTPGFHQTLLSPRKAAPEAFECIERKHSSFVMVVSVNVRSVMLCARFDKHPDHDPKETR